MPAAHKLVLGEEERVTLEEMSKHHPKAYMRERASAVLKVANGLSIRQVADIGCLKRREWETVAKWVKDYEQHGLRGLYLRAGRGRKGAFSP
jgi:transposase